METYNVLLVVIGSSSVVITFSLLLIHTFKLGFDISQKK